MTTVRITAEQARKNIANREALKRKARGHRDAAVAEREEKRAAVENLPGWLNGDKTALPMRPPGKGAP